MRPFQRLLLDANAILNASFIPNSWSSQAVGLGLRNEVQYYVGDDTLRESRAAAIRLAREVGAKQDPLPFIERFIRLIGAIQVTASRGLPPPQVIPRHDCHLYAESIAANAAIFTSDSELWLACKQANVPVYLPLEVIRAIAGESLSTTAFGVTPRSNTGLLFFRGYPSNWGGIVSKGKFSAAHLPGGFWLYYDAEKRRWVAEIEGRKPLYIPIQITKGDSLQTVALSWRSGDNIIFRAAGMRSPASERLLAPIAVTASNSIRIGSHSDGDHMWSGGVYHMIFDDRPLSGDTWKLVLQNRDLTPNPYDSDRLRVRMALTLR